MAKKHRKESFGTKLRNLREKEGLSIEDLATQLKMRPSHLKKLESDEILPPVAEIITLARLLSVDPSAFMGEKETGASRGKKRKEIATRTSDYAYEQLSSDSGDKNMMAFRVTIDPRSKHPKVGYRHDGEEFIYVLSGRLKITVGKKTSTLGPDESVQFDSGKPHRLSNPGNEPTVMVVVIFAK